MFWATRDNGKPSKRIISLRCLSSIAITLSVQTCDDCAIAFAELKCGFIYHSGGPSSFYAFSGRVRKQESPAVHILTTTCVFRKLAFAFFICTSTS